MTLICSCCQGDSWPASHSTHCNKNAAYEHSYPKKTKQKKKCKTHICNNKLLIGYIFNFRIFSIHYKHILYFEVLKVLLQAVFQLQHQYQYHKELQNRNNEDICQCIVHLEKKNRKSMERTSIGSTVRIATCAWTNTCSNSTFGVKVFEDWGCEFHYTEEHNV